MKKTFPGRTASDVVESFMALHSLAGGKGGGYWVLPSSRVMYDSSHFPEHLQSRISPVSETLGEDRVCQTEVKKLGDRALGFRWPARVFALAPASWSAAVLWRCRSASIGQKRQWTGALQNLAD